MRKLQFRFSSISINYINLRRILPMAALSVSSVGTLLFVSIFPVLMLVPSGVAADRFSGLCPTSYPRQVSFNDTGRCYTVGTQGPCPKMMVVASDPRYPNRGKCRCKSLGSSCFGRPLLEWDDRCYFEFSQGPCRKGHWLVRGKQGSATCHKNPCPLTENQRLLLRDEVPRKNFYFTMHNSLECLKTGTQAFCPSGSSLYFLGSQSEPKCIDYEPWDCDLYVGPSSYEFLTLRQGQGDSKQSKPAPGFGVPYDGI